VLLATIDWTVVAVSGITGATAIMVAAISLIGVRFASRATMRQAELQMTSLREQRDEDRREARRECYEALLAQERLLARVVMRDEALTATEFDEWLAGWHKCFTAVIVNATEDVHDVAQRITGLFTEMWNQHIALQPPPPNPDDVASAFHRNLRLGYAAIQQRLEEARRLLTSEMRSDVGALKQTA
jgi:hypothetical protein